MNTYTQLNIIFAQKHGMTAQHRDGRLRGHAGAGAALAKHHGDRLAGQAISQRGGSLAALYLRLARGAVAHEVGKLGGREVGNGHEMPGGGR